MWRASRKTRLRPSITSITMGAGLRARTSGSMVRRAPAMRRKKSTLPEVVTSVAPAATNARMPPAWSS